MKTPLQLLVAPTALKGSFSCVQALQVIQQTLSHALADLPLVLQNCPMADGGDGTLEALLATPLGFQAYHTQVMGPLPNQTVSATYLIHPQKEIAVIEAAQAHGMAQLPSGILDPLGSTSFGVGQLLHHVRQKWPNLQEIVLTLGGSASTDAGLGALQALGCNILGTKGQAISFPLNGGKLLDISKIELPDWHIPLKLLTDVLNPLLGPQGTASTYAPQKGATVQQVELLEAGLHSLTRVLKGQGLASQADFPGMGAAGGLAYGLSLLPHTTIGSGFEWLAQATGLQHQLAQSQMIITAEGRFDRQSLSGKGTGQLIAWSASQPNPVPVWVLCGQKQMRLQLPPWVTVICGQDTGMSIQDALANPQRLLEQTTQQAAAEIRTSLQAPLDTEAP